MVLKGKFNYTRKPHESLHGVYCYNSQSTYVAILFDTPTINKHQRMYFNIVQSSNKALI